MEGIVSDMINEISWDNLFLFDWLDLQWKIHPTFGFIKNFLTSLLHPRQLA